MNKDKEHTGKVVLYLDIAQQLETSIMRGEWTPGQKLPPLSHLATRFGVSKAVIREACSVMVGAGLLELRHGDGTYVKTLTLDSVLRPVHAALLLAQSDLRALLEVGLWLEQGIAASAAMKRSERDCEALAESLFYMESGRGNMELVVEGERMFHMGMVDAAGNAMASNLLRILYHPLSSILLLLGKNEPIQDIMISTHRALYGSILNMDAQAAARQIEIYRRTLQDRASQLRDVPVNSDIQSLGVIGS
ncbi:MAG: GntR family transcriptional regulator [Acidibacillus sp.]|uniref:HTH gntR-type domain-containing protein n=1 Tax=Sulfoacidibacillus ferrooxidans TaxID=2005001 RepID=A0A9X2ABA7_9BACL|nr:GntR family transcriptional regulator [Sulfoacidibacillus ferrooxidans]MCI0182514.1 hypothetical protein [Sulfoacidibacillus ferrooxidans]MCY0894211.1 GntR family transcriptional regulator [Acidibacillus sp.]